MNKISISHMSNSHSSWLRSLEFYKNEVSHLRNILTEVAGKNSAAPVMQQVEHYENQLKVQTDNIDRLAHDIRINSNQIADNARTAGAGYINGELFDAHSQLQEQFETEEKVVNELRRSFNRFAAEWM